jgi:RNA polymerase sigma factor (sigma-70 family)
VEEQGSERPDGRVPGVPDDAALVAAARWEPEQFGALYERYVDQVYRYIGARVASRADAEDLVAGVFLRAFQRLGDYRGNGTFRAWLFAIAHHAVIDAYRQRGKAPSAVGVDGAAGVEDSAPNPEQRVLERERLTAVALVWARLPSDQQAALALKFAGGLSNAEIGRIMGRREGAVKLLIYRGMRAIRRQCVPNEEG